MVRSALLTVTQITSGGSRPVEMVTFALSMRAISVGSTAYSQALEIPLMSGSSTDSGLVVSTATPLS